MVYAHFRKKLTSARTEGGVQVAVSTHADESRVVRVPEDRSRLVRGYGCSWYALFSRHPLGGTAQAKLAVRGNWITVDAKGLYES